MITLSEITHWLKSSIPGIILLGALGSILALILLKLLELLKNALIALLTRVLPAQIKKLTSWLLEKLLDITIKTGFNFGYEFGRTSVSDPRGEVAYFAIQLSRLMGWLAIFVVAMNFSLSLFTQQSTIVLTVGGYLMLVVGMLSGFWAFRHIVAITLAARHIPKLIFKSRRESAKADDKPALKE
jgi:hypothetical protein